MISVDETRDRLLGKYQIFQAHDNLKYLKTMRQALDKKRELKRVIEQDGFLHLFTNQIAYQFEDSRALCLTLFNYIYMPLKQDTFRWAYVNTPFSIFLIQQKCVVGVFQNGFNLFGFHLDSAQDNVEEAFLRNENVKLYAQKF